MNSTVPKIVGAAGAAGLALGGKKLIASGRSQFLSRRDRLAMEKEASEIKDKEVCENIRFKWEDGECKIHYPISGYYIFHGEEVKNNRSEADCLDGDYFWWRESSQKCHTIRTVFGPTFEKDIWYWEEVEKTKMKATAGSSMEHMNNNGLWRIKKHGNSYAIVFPKNKMYWDEKKLN